MSSMSDSDTFDWREENEGVVALRQHAIAVYENTAGLVVLRRDWDEDIDPIILVTKANVPALVQALVRVAGLEPRAQVLLPPPHEPSPGAVRQKRFRERHRNADPLGDTHQREFMEAEFAHAS